MKFFNKLNLSTQITIFFNILVLIIFLIIGLTVFVKKEKNIKSALDARVKNHLTDLVSYIEQEELHKKSIVEYQFQQERKKIVKSDSTDLSILWDELHDGILMKAEMQSMKNLKKIFSTKSYFSSGIVFLLDVKGKYLIHPTSEGRTFSHIPLVNHIISSGKKYDNLEFVSPQDEKGTKKILYYKYCELQNAFVGVSFDKKEVMQPLYSAYLLFIIALLVTLFVFSFGIPLLSKNIFSKLNNLSSVIKEMSEGKLVKKIDYETTNEIGKIVCYLNTLIEGLRNTAKFSNEIEEGNLKAKYQPLGKDDVLGNSLLEMRKSLVAASEEDIKRKKEDYKLNWVTKGLALFGDILRQNNDDIEKLSYNVISNLVKYLEANQGGMFIVNDDNIENLFFELKAMIAYNKRKYITKELEFGEGVVGNCALEQETIYMTKLPKGYMQITSGLGEASPKSLLVVPLKFNNEIFGAIEIASLSELEKYKIEFVERLAETIASTISSVKINVKTAHLLKESEEQGQKLANQEEQMRKNIDELKATQQEAARTQEEAIGFVNAVNHTIIRADYDTKGNIIYSNTKLQEIMGFSARELEGRKYTMFLTGKDVKEFNTAWERLVRGGRHYEKEVEYRTKNGTIWLLATYTPVRNNRGEVARILYLGIDISKEKQKNIAYKNDIKAIDSSIIKSEYKTDGTIISDNILMQRFLKYHEDENAGRNIFEIKTKEAIKDFKIVWNQAINGIPAEYQEKVETSEKIEKWLQGTLTPVKDNHGKVYKIIYIANDITKIKELETETTERNKDLQNTQQNLKNNMEKLQYLQENMKVRQAEMQSILDTIDPLTSISELDMKGNILSVNRTFATIFGVSQEYSKGKHHRAFARFENSSEYNNFWENLKSGISQNRIVEVKNNNQKYWLSETYSPVLDELGNPIKILVFGFDISESKRSEETLQLQAETLKSAEEELRQNLEELQTTQEEMSVQQAEMKSLIDSINPVACISEIDMKGNIQKVNETFAQTVGKVQTEIIGEKYNEFIRLENKEEYDNFWKELKQGNTKQFINENTYNDKKVWLSETYSPVLDENGVPFKILNIAYNITESKLENEKLKKRADELQAGEEEFKQTLEMLEHSQTEIMQKQTEYQTFLASIEEYVGVVEVEIEGNISKINSLVENIFEVSDDDVFDEPLNTVLPFENDEEYQNYLEKLKNGELISRKYKAGKEEIELSETANPLYANDGSVYKIIISLIVER